MYHYHYYPHLHPAHCLYIIAACLGFLLACYHCQPCTHQGKYSIGGLFGIVVGVFLAALKWFIDPNN